ncbi:MAG: hypothetical protein AAGD25_14890 [Cyanobacteria bacterium P01_F01_bin.150]
MLGKGRSLLGCGKGGRFIVGKESDRNDMELGDRGCVSELSTL